MNKINFLRTCMTTVIGKFNTETSVKDIFDKISIENNIIEDVQFLSKYYKNSEGEMVHEGIQAENLKCFPNTLTILCKYKEKQFKIRWFYSKKLNKIHVASGLKQSLAADIVRKFIKYMATRIQCDTIQPIHNVLCNGLAQAKKGVNLYELSKFLDKTTLTYVFTPDNHAALKIYHELGTVSIHSSGKILYMGSKNEMELIKLHKIISIMGNKWTGII